MRKQYYENAEAICKRLSFGPFAEHLQRAEKIKFAAIALEPPGASDLTFMQTDPMDVITADVTEDLRPLVVNPTGAQACGLWDIGAAGFEEDLACRSTLSMSLRDALYPIGRDELVYSPNVWAFRNAGWRRVKSFQFSVVSLPPMTRADFSVDNDRAHFAAQFRAVFALAATRGHRSVVLNAFGCQADNNPDGVAQIFGEVVSQYGGAFKRVTVVFEMSEGAVLASFRNHARVDSKCSDIDRPD